MNKVKEAQNQELLGLRLRRLMEMAADCIMAHLLIQDATKAPDCSPNRCCISELAKRKLKKHCSFINSSMLTNNKATDNNIS